MALLTLTSDIGTQDFVIGAIKGQLLNTYPNFQLVDISHTIEPFNFSQTAYVCSNSFWQFPPHTFHLVLVNLFQKKPTHLLLAFHQNQYIACADNGLLGLICGQKPEQVISIPLPNHLPKTTLLCTNVWAETIKAILEGKNFHQMGIEPDTIVELKPIQATFGADWIEGQIIHIDHFENVVINIKKDAFEAHRKQRSFQIEFRRDEVINKMSETYADVQQNDKLALFNAAGYLEIAINKGNAAGLFGLQVFKNESQEAFQSSKFFYQKVRIRFV